MPKTVKPSADERQITITLTPADVDALEEIHRRAAEDWNDYRTGGYGPGDYGNEWTSVKRTNDAHMKAGAKILKRCYAIMRQMERGH